MDAAALKHMASNFAKLNKFEGVNFRRWQKKMHFLLFSMSVVYVLTTPILDDGDDATVDQIRKKAKWDNNDYVCKGLILNGMSDSLFDIYQNVESSKELWDSLEAKYMVEDASSKKFLVSNFINYKMTDSRPVMKQYNELLDFKHTLKHLNEELTLIELGSHLHIKESLKIQDSDKPKGNNLLVLQLSIWWSITNPPGINSSVDGSTNSLKGQNMFNKSFQIYYVTYVSEAYFVQDDDVAWWVDSGATVHVCKDIYWFKTYESLNNGSILHMGNESTALVHGRGCVDLKFSSGKIISLFNVLHVPNIRKNLVYSSVWNNYSYKQVIESNKFVLSKHGVFIGFGYLSNHMFRLNIVNDNIGSTFMSTSKLNDSIIWHARLGHVHFKRMQDMSKDGLITAFDKYTKKLRMTKVIKGEFEKIKDVKVEDVLLACDTSLEVFNNEVNRLSRMDDDLFTYEVEVANIPCDSKIDDDSDHEADDDMGYDPSDVAFTEWLGSKIFNYKTIDHYTMKALGIYWIRGDDEVELTDEESFDNMDEVAEVFRIDTNIFETPMCKAFKEFNYLLQIDPDLLTKNIEGFKTYEHYKDD
ncbi:zinc finger, CCHC-type containing protein [Tanacetum coccineum]